jgi:predicted nucleotidyltransferase
MQVQEFFNTSGFDTTKLTSHYVLNPAIFDDENKMHDKVRERLLFMAEEFLKTITKKEINVRDIIVAGSNANYNYNSSSDIDLHIQIDSSEIFPNVDPKLVKDHLTAKKSDWNRKRPVTFWGVPVEIYIEDTDTPPTTGGIFSVLHNKWLIEPRSLVYKSPGGTDRRKEAAKLAAQWAVDIRKAIASNDPDAMHNCFAQIRARRAERLNVGDETSAENLAYKLLRARGDINKLFDAIDNAATAALSFDKNEPLNEFVFDKTVTYHKKLNPYLWEGGLLKDEVRTKLLQIARAFNEFIGLKLTILDIRFKGSMANYNYTSSSDIDVHLVADVTPEQEEFIDAKRIAWKEKYKGINVYGFPVELGVDRPNKPHTSSAVYSLLHDEWVDKPTYAKPETDVAKARELFSTWKLAMAEAIKTGDLKIIKRTEGKIRGIRDKVLAGSTDPEARRLMELSAENVAYKWLRDTGVFEQCKALYNADRVEKLSLEKKRGLLGLLGL